MGACAFVNTEERCAMGQDVCRIRSLNENQRFLNFLLHSEFMGTQLKQVLIGSTFNRINVAEIKSLLVLVPPRIEQDEIVELLDAKMRELDAPIDAVQREIRLMTEFRTRVVADIVTGKLDVRAVTACLPDDVEEAAPIDATELIAGDGDEDDDLDAEPEEAVA